LFTGLSTKETAPPPRTGPSPMPGPRNRGERRPL